MLSQAGKFPPLKRDRLQSSNTHLQIGISRYGTQGNLELLQSDSWSCPKAGNIILLLNDMLALQTYLCPEPPFFQQGLNIYQVLNILQHQLYFWKGHQGFHSLAEAVLCDSCEKQH